MVMIPDNKFEEKSTFWASYQFGKFCLLLKSLLMKLLLPADAELDDDIDAFMIMGNYALTDSAALTFRYSTQNSTDGTTNKLKRIKFTVSPKLCIQ